MHAQIQHFVALSFLVKTTFSFVAYWLRTWRTSGITGVFFSDVFIVNLSFGFNLFLELASRSSLRQNVHTHTLGFWWRRNVHTHSLGFGWWGGNGEASWYFFTWTVGVLVVGLCGHLLPLWLCHHHLVNFGWLLDQVNLPSNLLFEIKYLSQTSLLNPFPLSIDHSVIPVYQLVSLINGLVLLLAGVDKSICKWFRLAVKF